MNEVAVEEELIQVNHTLKLVVGAHEETDCILDI